MIIERNVTLSSYTSYKTGGKALYFAKCYNSQDTAAALKFAVDNNMPYEIIGGGSNLLIHDDGYKGLIISTAELNRYIINKGSNIIKCGAGISLAELVYYTCQKGLAGMESMAGIPGSLGGAVRMNAGAYDQEIKDTCLSVTLMDTKGNMKTVSNKDIGFSYRKSKAVDNHIVLSAEFSYTKKTPEELLAKRKEILAKRREKQPLHKPSCGSVFKRPEGNYAGTLIEKCGLKGYRIGGAVVSEKHGNFILNENNATSADIYNLIQHVIQEVYNQTGITLEPEVRMIGFNK